MISETFEFAEPLIVDYWLDHLLTPNDKKYGRGTLQDAVTTVVIKNAGNGRPKENLRSKVLIRDGRWIDGLTIDHINSDPSDNRRVNLQMVTRSENNAKRRDWRSMPHIYEPLEKELGMRLYHFKFNIELDDDNADLLEPLYRKYWEGKLLYGVGCTLYAAANPGLHLHVLKANGVTVQKGMHVHHKNDNPFDNRFDNLAVVTPKINMQLRSDKIKLRLDTALEAVV